jgi:hypothetical protein
VLSIDILVFYASAELVPGIRPIETKGNILLRSHLSPQVDLFMRCNDPSSRLAFATLDFLLPYLTFSWSHLSIFTVDGLNSRIKTGTDPCLATPLP